MYEVIVVDDELSVAEILAEHVSRLPMFHVAGIYPNGSAALEHLKSKPVHVLITDVRMPNITGIDLAAYAHENMPGLFVVLISAYSEFEYAKKAITYGVTEYLTKPVSIAQLRDVLARISEKLDRDQREVRMTGSELMLKCDSLMDRFLVDKNIQPVLDFGGCINEMPEGQLYWVIEFALDNERVERLAQQILHVMQKEHSGLHCPCAHGNDRNTECCFLMMEKPDKVESAVNAIRYAIWRYLNVSLNAKVVGRFESAADAADGIKRIREKYLENYSNETMNVEDVKQYILTHLNKDISRDMVARTFSISPSHFSRLFTELCGCTYKEYVLEARIKKARELLEKGKSSREVCQSVGMNDQQYFGRVFMQRVGLTMSEYRRKHLQEGVKP